MTDTPSECECKVGRVAAEYDLAETSRELAERRRGETGERASLRALAEFFNQEVLRAAIRAAGGNPLEGEVENVYRLLVDDDVTSGTRTRVRKRLADEGVDPDAVERAFVSHPTVGRHLQVCAGVETSSPARIDEEAAIDRVHKLGSRAEAVAGSTVEQLRDADRVAAGDVAVLVDTQVLCRDCGVQTDFRTFVERGGCDCNR